MAKLNKLQIATLPDAVLDRRQAVPALIEHPGDFLMVAGLAGTAWELSALTHESPSLFGLGGAMGAAPMMGLGLALAQPKRRVLVATGDGELLMNVGALATIALQNPPNLTIICVDNGHYGETGNQESHTGFGVRLDIIAAGCGFPVVHVINTEADMAEGRRLVCEGGGLTFILLRVTEGPATHDGKKISFLMSNGIVSGPPCLDDALVLLRLQLEWGADEAIDLDPIDRLQTPQRQPPRRPAALPEPLKGTPAERALASAAQASTFEELRATLVNFEGCGLRDTASNLVFAEGSPASTTLIIGEPPGREEDRSGHPFAGLEGQLLDQMLTSVGLRRADLMLTPLLPWRPPGGRPPSPAEIAICQPFLHRLIVLLKPHRIVLFGGTAARAMLPQTHSRRRGPRAWFEVNIPGMHCSLPAMVLPGLGEMLKNPPLRRDAWAGVRLLRRALDHAQTQT